ncbi:DUF554 domain-containing protein [Peribacillus frigoritolerans]|jgi:uncharacterized protein|uniref:DUF554 domain-containing protein n=1 Tax=Peribacillus castrilensis TaxID=2897690 RepID=A0AAW9N5G1_9BACI|nr:MULTISPECIES: DUF554 domain-containing protein [Peribacillus]KOR81251.1 hypothetical protein AM232_24565 [Bacillus sp. FJAT-21352]KOR85066.1 hypothetical protein AM233_14160 [Bacillus sp. FJAT-22058]MEC0271489.1 DUF554 domain-containing protein [Peribacillus castrilensis]PRS37179.1 DUF554 domain-containing protein [Bacillus sp. RJGP41]AZV61919.1 DUF554 domain-containing protein [Peribacillus frigoritolerans]
MVLLGALVNGACILIGSILGRFLQHIPEKIKETVMSGIGLAVMVLGLQMGFKSDNFLVVILSIVGGAVLGEWMNLEGRLNSLGNWIERRMKAKEGTSISQGFVTATLIFGIGAMAIIGALDSGIRNDHDVLITKAIIDGFTALVLASTLGIGVLFSAFPIILYEGFLAVFSRQINTMIPSALMDSFILEMTATGGVMILAIGLNIIGVTKIRVANLLPGIMITAILVTFMYYV